MSTSFILLAASDIAYIATPVRPMITTIPASASSPAINCFVSILLNNQIAVPIIPTNVAVATANNIVDLNKPGYAKNKPPPISSATADNPTIIPNSVATRWAFWIDLDASIYVPIVKPTNNASNPTNSNVASGIPGIFMNAPPIIIVNAEMATINPNFSTVLISESMNLEANAYVNVTAPTKAASSAANNNVVSIIQGFSWNK